MQPNMRPTPGVGRYVRSIVTVLEIHGNWPAAAASAGTPPLPKQPVPNGAKLAATPGAT